MTARILLTLIIILLSSNSFSASIRVLKPSVVLPIDQTILNDLLEKSPPVIKSIVKQLSYRLAQCDKEIQVLKNKKI